MNKSDRQQARAASLVAPHGRLLPVLALLAFCLFSNSVAAQEVPVDNQNQGTVSLPTATVHEAPVENQIQSPAPVPFIVITGTLLEKGTKKPLARVNIYCFPESSPEKPIKTGTDKSGKFSIKVPKGKIKWVLTASGYKRLERDDEQRMDIAVASRAFYLEKISYLS